MFKQREQVTGVAFYCKDCERIVDAHQVGRKYVYSCNICKTKNVAFGTEKSIRSYFHFDEVAPAAPAAAATPATSTTPAASATSAQPAHQSTAKTPAAPQQSAQQPAQNQSQHRPQ